MANKASVSPSENDWRAESDHRTIQQACEIMADKIRMKGVLRQHAKMEEGKKKMSAMLAHFKMKGGGGY